MTDTVKNSCQREERNRISQRASKERDVGPRLGEESNKWFDFSNNMKTKSKPKIDQNAKKNQVNLGYGTLLNCVLKKKETMLSNYMLFTTLHCAWKGYNRKSKSKK